MHWDILCLQETYSVSTGKFSCWLKAAQSTGIVPPNYQCLSSPGTNRSSGVANIYKSHFQLFSSSMDQDGRFINTQFSFQSQLFQICNLYGPNNAKEGNQFFESLYPVLDPTIPCILCGYFHTVVDPHLDRRGCNTSSKWAYNLSRTLTELTSTYGLHDV